MAATDQVALNTTPPPQNGTELVNGTENLSLKSGSVTYVTPRSTLSSNTITVPNTKGRTDPNGSLRGVLDADDYNRFSGTLALANTNQSSGTDISNHNLNNFGASDDGGQQVIERNSVVDTSNDGRSQSTVNGRFSPSGERLYAFNPAGTVFRKVLVESGEALGKAFTRELIRRGVRIGGRELTEATVKRLVIEVSTESVERLSASQLRDPRLVMSLVMGSRVGGVTIGELAVKSGVSVTQMIATIMALREINVDRRSLVEKVLDFVLDIEPVASDDPVAFQAAYDRIYPGLQRAEQEIKASLNQSLNAAEQLSTGAAQQSQQNNTTNVPNPDPTPPTVQVSATQPSTIGGVQAIRVPYSEQALKQGLSNTTAFNAANSDRAALAYPVLDPQTNQWYVEQIGPITPTSARTLMFWLNERGLLPLGWNTDTLLRAQNIGGWKSGDHIVSPEEDLRWRESNAYFNNLTPEQVSTAVQSGALTVNGKTGVVYPADQLYPITQQTTRANVQERGNVSLALLRGYNIPEPNGRSISVQGIEVFPDLTPGEARSLLNSAGGFDNNGQPLQNGRNTLLAPEGQTGIDWNLANNGLSREGLNNRDNVISGGNRQGNNTPPETPTTTPTVPTRAQLLDQFLTNVQNPQEKQALHQALEEKLASSGVVSDAQVRTFLNNLSGADGKFGPEDVTWNAILKRAGEILNPAEVTTNEPTDQSSNDNVRYLDPATNTLSNQPASNDDIKFEIADRVPAGATAVPLWINRTTGEVSREQQSGTDWSAVRAVGREIRHPDGRIERQVIIIDNGNNNQPPNQPPGKPPGSQPGGGGFNRWLWGLFGASLGLQILGHLRQENDRLVPSFGYGSAETANRQLLDLATQRSTPEQLRNTRTNIWSNYLDASVTELRNARNLFGRPMFDDAQIAEYQRIVDSFKSNQLKNEPELTGNDTLPAQQRLRFSAAIPNATQQNQVEWLAYAINKVNELATRDTSQLAVRGLGVPGAGREVGVNQLNLQTIRDRYPQPFSANNTGVEERSSTLQRAQEDVWRSYLNQGPEKLGFKDDVARVNAWEREVNTWLASDRKVPFMPTSDLLVPRNDQERTQLTSFLARANYAADRDVRVLTQDAARSLQTQMRTQEAQFQGQAKTELQRINVLVADINRIAPDSKLPEPRRSTDASGRPTVTATEANRVIGALRQIDAQLQVPEQSLFELTTRLRGEVVNTADPDQKARLREVLQYAEIQLQSVRQLRAGAQQQIEALKPFANAPNGNANNGDTTDENTTNTQPNRESTPIPSVTPTLPPGLNPSTVTPQPTP
jgi:hypothetical protein